LAGNDVAKERQCADGSQKAASPSRLRLPLVTLKDVQRELARVYRAMKADQMELGKGRSLVYALAQLSRSIEGSDLEARMALLAAQLASKP
jgi:hypothetical protein